MEVRDFAIKLQNEHDRACSTVNVVERELYANALTLKLQGWAKEFDLA